MMDIRTAGEVLVELGGRARALRLLRDFSQAELAERSGLGVATIQRFEKSGHVSLENVYRIAVALSAEEGFAKLFVLPEYGSLDEALARPAKVARRRARRQRPAGGSAR